MQLPRGSRLWTTKSRPGTGDTLPTGSGDVSEAAWLGMRFRWSGGCASVARQASFFIQAVPFPVLSVPSVPGLHMPARSIANANISFGLVSVPREPVFVSGIRRRDFVQHAAQDVQIPAQATVHLHEGRRSRLA